MKVCEKKSVVVWPSFQCHMQSMYHCQKRDIKGLYAVFIFHITHAILKVMESDFFVEQSFNDDHKIKHQ